MMKTLVWLSSYSLCSRNYTIMRQFGVVEATDESQIYGWLAMVVVSEPKAHATIVFN